MVHSNNLQITGNTSNCCIVFYSAPFAHLISTNHCRYKEHPRQHCASRQRQASGSFENCSTLRPLWSAGFQSYKSHLLSSAIATFIDINLMLLSDFQFAY